MPTVNQSTAKRRHTAREVSTMSKEKSVTPKATTRRKFLTGAALATAAVSAPNVVKAQGVINMRFQSTWPSKDIFHEYALDFGKRVNDMTGGDLKIEVLPGGDIVAAIDRGLLDAAEFNNASSDRALGFADVSKLCMLQSYHQNAEQLEISFNKTKFNGLPPKLKATIEGAVEACSQDMMWKAIDRNSQDYITLQTTDKVKFFRTPDSILKRQLELYDEITKKYVASNPLFKEIIQSQLAFAKRALQWKQDNITPRKMAFDHYFGPNAKTPI